MNATDDPEGYETVTETEVDSRGRVSLGRAGATPGRRYRVQTRPDGAILLIPVVSIPERELSVWTDPDLAARIRKGIDPKELTVVAAAAREANTLIDQRTFSWTAFFNHLEATLPPDVMLVSVRPSIDRGATRVSMVVLGRTPEDIDEFMEKLEATGAFEKILPRQMDKTDEGLNRAVLDSVYTPDQAEAKPADEAKPGEPGKPGEQPKADPGTPKDRSKTGNQAKPGAKSGATSKTADRAGTRGILQTKLAEAKS